MNETIFSAVDHYISSLLAKEDQILEHILEELDKNEIPNASISPNQGKFLQVMAAMCNAKRILELGTLGGYSTVWLARSIPESGKVISIEADPFHAEIAKKNMIHAGLEKKVEIRTGKALELLQDLVKNNEPAFDLFFIDADKPPYKEYFEYALKLSRPGSVIICDNVIRNGKVLDQNSDDEKVQGVQRLNSFLKNCKEVTATILQNVGIKEYDGMVIAVVNH